MRIKLITTILFTCVLSACQPQATTENSKNNAASATNPAKAVASGDMASVKKNIQAALEQAYPEQKVQIKSVDAAPVAGLYEVVVFPNQVVYMDGSGNYMFVGNLLDVKKQINLTEEKMADLNRIDYRLCHLIRPSKKCVAMANTKWRYSATLIVRSVRNWNMKLRK